MSSQRHNVLIIHSREDSEFAAFVARSLSEATLDLWIDKLDASTEPTWEEQRNWEERTKALTRAWSLLIVLSPSSVASTRFQEAISIALRLERKTVIVLLLGDCELPLPLQKYRLIDFRKDEVRGREVSTLLLKAELSLAAQPYERALAYAESCRSEFPAEAMALHRLLEKKVYGVPNDLLIDNVQFTLTGPSVLIVAQAHELRFWVHVEQERKTVLKRASELHKVPRSELSIKSEGPYPLARGSCLSIRLKIKGLNCPEPHKWITWTGEIGCTGFIVEVPNDASEGAYSGGASIKLNGCEIARVSFVVCVGRTQQKITGIPVSTEVHRAAFASYASEDRAEVLSRVQGMETAYKGLSVFVDVVNIRSGQNWEKELTRRINESDVFYLFWCRHASASEWVAKEWHLAFAAKGGDFIDPVPLEPPQLAPPPQELIGKHFNDPLLAFIAAAGGGHS